MKNLLLTSAALLALMLSPLAQAADAASASTSASKPSTQHATGVPTVGKQPSGQQSKMTECNQKAGDAKGDERKSMMKECLSTKKETQQSRMKTCNADAKGKSGDERKSFMKECLSNKPA